MIATITFHWATNYGAILQAYALQKYLLNKGYDTEIINYVPSKIKISQLAGIVKKHDFHTLIKELKLKKFRRKELKLSKKVFRNNAELFGCCDMYDAIICGSDQIWNESFTNSGEGKPTLSYYLNFANNNVEKISYAISFGTDELQEKTIKLIQPCLKRFKRISVRENTGADILRNLGYNADVVIDPTLLLDSDEYEALIKNTSTDYEDVFSYILHNNQEEAIEVCKYFKNKYGEKPEGEFYNPNLGVYEWLLKIKNSRLVVTNSFHGVVFSIIFHKNFLTIPVSGYKMNDRIHTLLSAVGLEDMIVSNYKKTELNRISERKIDWKEVDKKINLMRLDSEKYIYSALNK